MTAVQAQLFWIAVQAYYLLAIQATNFDSRSGQFTRQPFRQNLYSHSDSNTCQPFRRNTFYSSSIKIMIAVQATCVDIRSGSISVKPKIVLAAQTTNLRIWVRLVVKNTTSSQHRHRFTSNDSQSIMAYKVSTGLSFLCFWATFQPSHSPVRPPRTIHSTLRNPEWGALHFVIPYAHQ